MQRPSATHARPGSFGIGLISLFLLAAPCQSVAHDPGLSTGQLRILPGRIETELTFARADIESLVELDADGDGHISLKELAVARPALEKLAREAWAIDVGNSLLALESCTFRFDETNNFHLFGTFKTRDTGTLTARSLLIDRLPRGHRHFVSVLDHTNDVVAEMLLSAGQSVITANLDKPSGPQLAEATRTFRNFLKVGIEHIITGYDHLLFLFALLMMAPRFREAAFIITSFTVAHSITLGLATLDLVKFQSKFAEPLIAATIVYVGIENLTLTNLARRRWLLTFAFGLVHGFGFAGALRDLGVNSGTTGIAIPLFSFNLGVEAGQILMAALLLPLIWWARKTPAFIRYGIPACSSVVIALGAWWFLERSVW